MRKFLVLPIVAALALPLSGCPMLMVGASGDGSAPAQPSLAAQSTILGLQTWMMLQQSKATEAAAAAKTVKEAEKQRARAASAGNILTSLGALRTESNCGKRLALATAVSGGLQSEFPTYQAELSLGTNLVGILAAGFPGCQ